MKILIVDDDYKARRILQAMLQDYGECDTVYNGSEAIEAFTMAWEDREPYALILMDIMMPEVDGQEAVKRIREIERGIGLRSVDEVKIIMTTALDDPKTVFDAYSKAGATSYMVKPIEQNKLMAELKDFGLIK